MTMPKALLTFLSRDWSGLALAATVALLAALAPSDATYLRWALLGLSGLLALGSLRYLLRRRAALRRHPAPGKLVDIGGYRLHVLAEGEARGKPAVVWLPGGHTGAYALHHLHRRIREEARSILVDRPGTGWSDVGPFPRTTAREALEIPAALAAAGETGPFVLVGHSFGGLLAANIARRSPDIVAGVILLDATPPDTILYGPRQKGLGRMRWQAFGAGLRRLFGLGADPQKKEIESNPVYARIMRLVEEQLGDAGVALKAVEGTAAGTCFANASIFRELTPRGLADAAWDAVTYDGDLGELPLWLVAPGDPEEARAVLPEAAAAQPEEVRRMMRVLQRTRERYLALSSSAHRVVTPQGTGHNFPFEVPECVVAVVREAQGQSHAPR
jgi:pimeloyl-ACP methyl ester carboxylesterase